jgi:hypothetical protein
MLSQINTERQSQAQIILVEKAPHLPRRRRHARFHYPQNTPSSVIAKMPAAKYAGILSPEANNIVPPPTPPKKLR